jgi:hypothetical protein
MDRDVPDRSVYVIGQGGHVKKSMLVLGLGCVVLASCGPLPAPASSGPEPALAMRLDPPPVHALLGQRAALGLTSEQIAELDEVGQQIHAENHPLLMRLEELQASRSDVTARQELLQVAGRIHVNNVRAMERVRGVLTDGQHGDVCTIFNGTTTARELRQVSDNDASLRMVNRPTTYMQVGSQTAHGPVWSWCAEAQTAAR